jgi:hypothetical protein
MVAKAMSVPNFIELTKMLRQSVSEAVFLRRKSCFVFFLLIPTVAFFVLNHDDRERGIQRKQDSAARRSRMLQCLV